MWKFANPIKHQIPDARWPTAAESSQSLLFQPIRVGPVALSSRTWVPAMVPWRATEDGLVTQDNLDWYRRFSKSPAPAPGVEAPRILGIPRGAPLRPRHERIFSRIEKLSCTPAGG